MVLASLATSGLLVSEWPIRFGLFGGVQGRCPVGVASGNVCLTYL